MFYYVRLPVADMRELPDPTSKVVSQALLGEEIQLKELRAEWALIATTDAYLGWVKKEALIARDTPFSATLEPARLSAHIYSLADTEYGPIATLPQGAKLQVIDASDPRWIHVELPDKRAAFIQKGDVEGGQDDLVSFSKRFLGLPYTWGGRSSFGYDCSGFVQMVYGRFGLKLPRDARQQILDSQGKEVPFEELALGDLIFWGKSGSIIQHVGMYLQEGEFIHTSSKENKPFLRISQLNDLVWSGSSESVYPFRAARRFDGLVK